MKRYKAFACLICAAAVFAAFSSPSFAESPAPEAAPQPQPAVPAPNPTEPAKEQIRQAPVPSENVTLDFREADIKNVLKIISYKSGVNIVTTPEVMGNVSIRLIDVPWELALDIILKTYGFGSQKQGNVILVTKMENVAKIQAEEALQTEIFTLKFLDAVDAEKIIIPLLSPRGKVSILYTRGQKGWKFGTFKIGKEQVKAGGLEKEIEAPPKAETVSIERSGAGDIVTKKAEFEPSIKSKTLIITDTPSSLDRIRNVILPEIDKKPRQVLIETRIMEVNRDKLKDLGIDWGTGTSGATGYGTAPADLYLGAKNTKTLAGRNLASEFTPNIFGPKEGVSTFPGVYPYKAGLEIIFKKLAGDKFQAILHALEEDVHTNTLSAPRLLTLDNQEAAILVGYHTPILSSTLTAPTTAGQEATVAQTLDYYQEIGIRLNVVPQVNEDGYINLLVHPSVTSSTSTVTATNQVGSGSANQISTSYPIIDVREAQTQILLKDGETIVMGGLLKDVKSKQTIGIPFLSKIPFFGLIFQREIDDIQKVDLLIFITARIVKEGDFTPEEIARMEKELGKDRTVKAEFNSKKKNKKQKAKAEPLSPAKEL